MCNFSVRLLLLSPKKNSECALSARGGQVPNFPQKLRFITECFRIVKRYVIFKCISLRICHLMTFKTFLTDTSNVAVRTMFL